MIYLTMHSVVTLIGPPTHLIYVKNTESVKKFLPTKGTRPIQFYREIFLTFRNSKSLLE